MNRIGWLAAGLLTAGAPTLAVPPPGHPTVPEAERLMRIPADAAERYQARVIEAIEANNYTYLHVEDGSGQRWIAAPRLRINPGSIIAFGEGRRFARFYSRKLKRTFDELVFVGPVRVVREAL